MSASFFIPKKINIGFQNRQGTYTGKLAYIIYFDEKGKLRKETSWNGWRDSKIDNEIHDNEPTSGFVLNKKAGGYDTGWNHRQTYVRVYDPRGFEFEITVPNLLYILENATSTKGKGLEGEFVYGWDGKDLVLIPTDAPDYKELVKLNELRHTKNFIKAKDLKIGATYLGKNGTEYTYMGKFDEYDYYGVKNQKQSFYFYNKGENYSSYITMKSISQKLVSVISEDCVENYAELMDVLEHRTNYSPIDSTRDEYIYYTLEEVLGSLKYDADNPYGRYRSLRVYSDYQGERQRTEILNYSDKPQYYERREVEYGYGWNKSTHWQNIRVDAESLEEIFVILKPMWKKIYLKNGKLYKEEK